MKILMAFLITLFGFVNLTRAEDYQGSSFTEVLAMLNEKNPSLRSAQEIEEFRVYQDGRLPHYLTNSTTIFSPQPTLVKDAQRTINEKYDYYDYLPKKLHPNGV